MSVQWNLDNNVRDTVVFMGGYCGKLKSDKQSPVFFFFPTLPSFFSPSLLFKAGVLKKLMHIYKLRKLEDVSCLGRLS